MEKEIQQAASLLGLCRFLVVLTGAGISQESGIPTFRDARNNYKPQVNPAELGTPEAFARDPERVWSWYRQRLGKIENAEPNAAHYTLVELESRFTSFLIISQNVDGLHQQAGSRNVLELHGSIRRARCSKECGKYSVIDVQAGGVPYCPECGSMMRPDVVWFNEPLPQDALETAMFISSYCDLMLIVGTSGLVTPAAYLPHQAKEHGAALVEINPSPSAITSHTDMFIQGVAGEALPLLLAAYDTVDCTR